MPWKIVQNARDAEHGPKGASFFSYKYNLVRDVFVLIQLFRRLDFEFQLRNTINF